MNPQQKHQRLHNFLAKISPTEGELESFTQDTGVRKRLDATEANAQEKENAHRALNKLEKREPLTHEEGTAVEAIILPRERPVVDIVNNTFSLPASPFEHLFNDNRIRERINRAIPSIGRIELPGHPTLPYGGTGFVVGERMLMTNRHVAEIFTSGLGLKDLLFRPGVSAGIDFLQELGSGPGQVLRVRSVQIIHPYWDMALLEVDGLSGHAPLVLSTVAVEDLTGREIVVVGYPALDPRNDIALQNRIFRNAFGVKRLQPGKINGNSNTDSYEHDVDALMHDSSTLGGNSGSALVDTGTGNVVGLHFGGRYLESNYAVPTHEMARDRRVASLGLNFEANIASTGVPWDGYWDQLEGAAAVSAPKTTHNGSPALAQPCANPPASAPGPGNWLSEVKIPIEIVVRVGSPVSAGLSGAAQPDRS